MANETISDDADNRLYVIDIHIIVPVYVSPFKDNGTAMLLIVAMTS